MRLVIVGFSGSIHLRKIVDVLDGLNWDVHVVSSVEHPWAEGFTGCTVHHMSAAFEPPAAAPGLRVIDHRPRLDGGTATQLERATELARLIDELRPEIVHSHEFQHAGYTTLLARERCVHPFPTWVVSNWGSDISYFARPPAHRRVVRQLLSRADAYWCECHRDVALARAEGFRGLVLPVLPIAGGYDLDMVAGLRQPTPPSQRRTIAVKGYQHEVGRSMNALAALAACSDLLAGYDIELYAVNAEHVADEATAVARSGGASLTVHRGVPYEEILRMQGRARISIGLSMSDGISTSFLETLLGGSFPIQSRTACAADWIVDGEGGILVDPTDIAGVAAAIRRGLTDDALVDRAQVVNDAIVRSSLDEASIRAAVQAGYRRIVAALPQSLTVRGSA